MGLPPCSVGSGDGSGGGCCCLCIMGGHLFALPLFKFKLLLLLLLLLAANPNPDAGRDSELIDLAAPPPLTVPMLLVAAPQFPLEPVKPAAMAASGGMVEEEVAAVEAGCSFGREAGPAAPMPETRNKVVRSRYLFFVSNQMRQYR